MTKTSFIAISGRPNVGKSTLMNAILGEKIAIVSSKPQTTRNRITGILTEGEEQFVFLDTPGVHKARTRLGGYMNKSARQTVASADAVMLIAEAGRSPIRSIFATVRRWRSRLPHMRRFIRLMPSFRQAR